MGGVTPPPPRVPSGRAEAVDPAGALPGAGRRSPGRRDAHACDRTPFSETFAGAGAAGEGGEPRPAWIILEIRMLCFRGVARVVSPQGYIRNGITAPNSSLSPAGGGPSLQGAEADSVGIRVLCHKRV